VRATARGHLPGGRPVTAAGPATEDPTQIARDNAAIYLQVAAPAGSDLVRQFAVTPAATDFFAGEADDLSRSYRDLPMVDPAVVPLWQALGELCEAQAAALRVAYQVVVHDDLDPYETAEQMHADISRGVYQVTSLHSHHPVWSPQTNVAFRIVHDILGHGVALSDFSFKGEVEAYQAQCRATPPRLWPVLFTEVIAQSAYANTHHLFGEQKVGLVPLTQAQIDAAVGKVMDAADPAYDALHYSASSTARQVAYHVSRDLNRDSIESLGLLLARSDDGRHIWLYPTREQALDHISAFPPTRTMDGVLTALDLYEVDITGMKTRKDPHALAADAGGVVVRQDIPPERLRRVSATARTAKPNVVPIFNGTGEKNYAYNAPYVVVAYMGPLMSDRLNEVNDLKVPVPWASDLRDSIREAERRAERYFAEEPQKAWADKSGYYLVFGSGNTTVAVGHARRLGDAWQPLHGKVGYTEADPSYLRILDRPKDAFAKFCKEIADSQPPGFNQHPLADADVVTIYRGIGLLPGQDPATSDKADNGGFGSGAGSSWTLDLSVAKAIAERGGAGFSGENNRFGQPRQVKADPGSRYNNTRAVVLRATVDLSQEGFGLLNDGRMYYSSEQEVDVRPGTEFTLTGWMEAEQVPVDRRAMQQAIEKAKADIADKGYSLADYAVTYRWPSSWRTTKIKRTASGRPKAVGHLPGGRVATVLS
jgi:hypothetical protein